MAQFAIKQDISYPPPNSLHAGINFPLCEKCLSLISAFCWKPYSKHMGASKVFPSCVMKLKGAAQSLTSSNMFGALVYFSEWVGIWVDFKECCKG